MNKPELEKPEEIERRTHTVEMRVKDAGYGKKTPTMEGYAANFNSLSEDLGGFRVACQGFACGFQGVRHGAVVAAKEHADGMQRIVCEFVDEQHGELACRDHRAFARAGAHEGDVDLERIGDRLCDGSG